MFASPESYSITLCSVLSSFSIKKCRAAPKQIANPKEKADNRQENLNEILQNYLCSLSVQLPAKILVLLDKETETKEHFCLI